MPWRRKGFRDRSARKKAGRRKRMRRKRLAGVLVGLAASAWIGILGQQGYFRPVARWAYFLSGRSGPTVGWGIGPSPMVDVTGPYRGKTHCYT